MSQSWRAFTADASAYRYDDDTLKAHWQRLHESDHEPLLDDAAIRELDTRHGVSNGQKAKAAAALLAQAWRHFHAGEFAAAVELGDRLGVLGANVANKATGIYARYLEPNTTRQLELFQAMAGRAENARQCMPTAANSHYLYAFALGRYSQGISVVKALAQGLGSKVKDALTRTLEINPNHADAHIAMGLYHAEIIDKVGALIGSLTYGADKNAAVTHFDQALALAPHSAIARIEYGNALLMLFGDKAYERASELYVTASDMKPADAAEHLDVELAKSELE